jgi:hypothetical protein
VGAHGQCRAPVAAGQWPGDTIGLVIGQSQRHACPHRDAADERALDLQVVPERAEVLREGGESEVSPPADVAFAVAAALQREQAHVGRCDAGGLSGIAAEPVLNDQRRSASAGIATGVRPG